MPPLLGSACDRYSVAIFRPWKVGARLGSGLGGGRDLFVAEDTYSISCGSISITNRTFELRLLVSEDTRMSELCNSAALSDFISK